MASYIPDKITPETLPSQKWMPDEASLQPSSEEIESNNFNIIKE